MTIIHLNVHINLETWRHLQLLMFYLNIKKSPKYDTGWNICGWGSRGFMIQGEKSIPASNARFGRKKRGWKAYFIQYFSKTAMCALNLPCTSL